MTTASSRDDEQIVGINVTPLVDITLVLLIIFMVTASFIARETMEVDLPRPARRAEVAPAVVSVVIDRESRVYFDGSLVDETALKARIVSAVAKAPETRAIIAADPHLDYGRVMHLIDFVKGSGIEKFVLNIQRSEAEAAGTGR